MILHRYWHGNDNPPAEPWLHQVLTNLHPDLQVRDWTDRDLPPALASRLAVDPLGADPRHRANVARWWLLDAYGGVWLDHDVIPLRPLPQGAWTAALDTTRTACAVRLPQGHGLPRAMLDAIDATPRDAASTTVDTSGDHLLQRVAAGWPAVDTLPLPFDALGHPIPGIASWAVHLWTTSSKVRLT